MLTQRLERHYVKGPFMRRRQHHVGRRTVEVGAKPVRRGDAPAISRYQPREPEVRHRGDQVIAYGTLMVEELGRYDSADRMAAQILGAGVAATIAVEPGDRVVTARLEFAAKHVALAHYSSIAHGCVRTRPAACATPPGIHDL